MSRVTVSQAVCALRMWLHPCIQIRHSLAVTNSLLAYGQTDMWHSRSRSVWMRVRCIGVPLNSYRRGRFDRRMKNLSLSLIGLATVSVRLMLGAVTV
jgi:hypothetical protein